MFRQQPTTLLLDDLRLSALFQHMHKSCLFFLRLFLPLHLKLLFPQHIGLALVVQLTHATPLCVHLVKTLVLREFLQHLCAEFALLGFLALLTFRLELGLVGIGGHELTSDAFLLGALLHLFLSLGLLELLVVQLTAESLDVVLFRSSPTLLAIQRLEDHTLRLLDLRLLFSDLTIAAVLLFLVP
jgi:hypothetical protein